MSTTADQLQAMKSGRSKKIRGQEVSRDGDDYIIDGDNLSLDEAVKRLDQSGRTGTDYNRLVFLECPPYSQDPIRHHRCANKSEHTALLEAVIKRKNYLYSAAVVKEDGQFLARPPFVLDWDSV